MVDVGRALARALATKRQLWFLSLSFSRDHGRHTPTSASSRPRAKPKHGRAAKEALVARAAAAAATAARSARSAMAAAAARRASKATTTTTASVAARACQAVLGEPLLARGRLG